MSLQRLPVKKGRPFILIALLAAIVVAMVMLSKCSHPIGDNKSLQLQKSKSGGDTLDVAIEISPLAYRMSGDTIVGLDYEIMKGISLLANRPVKFHPFAPLKEALDGIRSGLYDVVISSLPSTESMKQKYKLTDHVYLDREILVQLADSKSHVGSADQLANDTVWIAAGSPFVQRIKNLSDEIGEPIHIVTPEGRTAEHLVMLVARGEIARAVVNEGLARRMKKEKYNNLDITTPVSFTQFQTWVVSEKNSWLPDSMNIWLKRFQDSDEYKAILDKYGLDSDL